MLVLAETCFCDPEFPESVWVPKRVHYTEVCDSLLLQHCINPGLPMPDQGQ